MTALVLGLFAGLTLVLPAWSPRVRAPFQSDANTRLVQIEHGQLAVVVPAALLLLRPSVGLVAAIVAPGLPWLLRRRTRRRHQAAIDHALPEVIDLITVVVGAGGTVADALRVVQARGPETIRPLLVTLLDRARAGTTIRVTLTSMTESFGEGYRPLSSALLGTVRDGAPVSSLLGRLGDEARAARRNRNLRLARQLPVQLLFPVVLCTLPAVVVGAVVPIVLLSLGRL